MGSRRVAKNRSLGAYLSSTEQMAKAAYIQNSSADLIASGSIVGDSLTPELNIGDKAIVSADFVSGASGWRIAGTGEAEFQTVDVRGNITADSGQIGNWNISGAAASRVFGTSTLFGTYLESSVDIGDNDLDITTGTYVGLFKSFVPDSVNIVTADRTSNIVTLTTAEEHSYAAGDQIIVTMVSGAYDTTMNNGGLPVTITSTTSTTITYSNTGSTVASGAAVGSVIQYIEDVAGLYLRDYGKVDFDYGYFSNEGVQFNSPYVVNAVKNPSFEYISGDTTEINDPTTATTSKNSWSFPASSIAESLLGAGTPFLFGVGTSGYFLAPGCVMWRGTAITSQYFKATLDYNALQHFRLLESDRTLYFGFDMWVIDFDTPFITTRPSFDISEIKFEFSNGATVDIYDVLTDECQSEWVSSSTPSWMYYTATTGGDVTLLRQRPIPRISGGKLLAQYQTLDSSGYASESDILIRFPAYLYSQSTSVVGSFTKTNKILGDATHAVGYGLDSVYLSTAERFFYGSKAFSISHGWWKADSSGYTRNVAQPSFASVETTTKWIDLDLDNQTFNLDKIDYLGFDSHATKTLLYEPSIASSSGTSSILSGYQPGLLSDPITYTRVTGGTYREEFSTITLDVDSRYIDATTDYQINTHDGAVINRAQHQIILLGGGVQDFESYNMSWAGVYGIYSEQVARAYLGSNTYATAKVVTTADASTLVSNVTTYSSDFSVYIDDGTATETYDLVARVDADGLDVSRGLGTAFATSPRIITYTTSINGATGVGMESRANSNSTRYHINFTNLNGLVGRISTNGSATSYVTSSDYRLKENIVLISGALDRVMALKPSRFNFIADGPENSVDGFLAHEVQEIVPEAISGDKDEVDENGNPVYQGIDQSKIVPVLTAAIQELAARLTILEGQ